MTRSKDEEQCKTQLHIDVFGRTPQLLATNLNTERVELKDGDILTYFEDYDVKM